jgi:hypothetical protein
MTGSDVLSILEAELRDSERRFDLFTRLASEESADLQQSLRTLFPDLDGLSLAEDFVAQALTARGQGVRLRQLIRLLVAGGN